MTTEQTFQSIETIDLTCVTGGRDTIPADVLEYYGEAVPRPPQPGQDAIPAHVLRYYGEAGPRRRQPRHDAPPAHVLQHYR